MNLKRLLKADATGIALAIILVLLTSGIAGLTSDPLTVSPPGATESEEISLVAGIIATTVGGLIGLAIAAASSRLKQPKRTFLIICGIGLLLSTISPLVQAEQPSTALWLNVMHFAAAIPIVGSLAAALPQTSK